MKQTYIFSYTIFPWNIAVWTEVKVLDQVHCYQFSAVVKMFIKLTVYARIVIDSYVTKTNYKKIHCE